MNIQQQKAYDLYITNPPIIDSKGHGMVRHSTAYLQRAFWAGYDNLDSWQNAKRGTEAVVGASRAGRNYRKMNGDILPSH